MGPGREAFEEMTKGTASQGDLPAPPPYCPPPCSSPSCGSGCSTIYPFSYLPSRFCSLGSRCCLNYGGMRGQGQFSKDKYIQIS